MYSIRLFCIFFFSTFAFSSYAQYFEQQRHKIDEMMAKDTDLSERKNTDAERIILQSMIVDLYEWGKKNKDLSPLQEAYIEYTYAWVMYTFENIIEESLHGFEKAYTYFNKEKDAKQKDIKLYYDILHHLAHIKKKYYSEYDVAERYYRDILTYYPKDSVMKYTNAMMMLAVMHSSLYKCHSANTLAAQAMELRFEKLAPNDIVLVSGLNVLGAIYEQCEEYSKAEDAYLRALKIYRAHHLGKYQNKYVEILNNLGVLYMHLDKYEEAENYLIQVLKYDEKDDKEGLSYSLSCHNLGVLYAHKKDFSKANYFYNVALNIEVKNYGKNNAEVALSYKNIGDFYANQSKYDFALRAYDECINIYKNLGIEEYKQAYIKILHAIATTKVSEKKYKEALQYLQEIMDLYHQMENDDYVLFLYLQILDKVIDVHIELGNLAEAKKYLQESFQTNAKLPFSINDISPLLNHKEWHSTQIAVNTLQALAKVKQREAYLAKSVNYKLLEESYALAQEALRINKFRLQEHKMEEEKIQVLQKNYGIIKDAFQAGVALNKPNFNADAFLLIESNKAALLSESIKARQAKSLLPIEIAEKEKELMLTYNDLNYALYEAYTAEEELEIRQELSEVTLKINDLKTTLQRDYPKYYNAVYSEDINTLAYTQSKLQDSELLLEYFVEDSAIYVLAITQQAAQLFVTPKIKTLLADEVKTFTRVLSNFEYIKRHPKIAYEEYTVLAYHFYEVLLKAPIATFSDKKKLIIIPDAELGVLPFEALLMEKAPTNSISYATLPYVIKQKMVVYHYAANLWSAHKNEQEQEVAHQGKIFAMAGYYKGSKSEAQAVKSANFLQPLAFVKEELQAVKEKYAGDFYLQHPNPEHLFKEKSASYDIIHLSMHGLGNEKNPLLSALYFSDFADDKQDNILEAWEIMQLPLTARLVVLSACESGVGTYLQGEGVSSLARAFMYAGASSLLVSLWKVNDKTTSILMQEYYQALAAGEDKAQALQSAKLHLIDSYTDNIAHPAYWAAFVQIGDDLPIVPRKDKNILVWVFFGIGGMVAFGSLYFYLRQRTQKRYISAA